LYCITVIRSEILN